MAGIYKKLEGVAKDPAPAVNFKKKLITLSYDPAKLDEKKLIAALDKSKFKAKVTPKKDDEDKKKDDDKKEDKK